MVGGPGQQLRDKTSRSRRWLTFRIRRLMMDSAAKTRSPTADSSILLSGTHSPYSSVLPRPELHRARTRRSAQAPTGGRAVGRALALQLWAVT